jgi:type IV secretory pathway protease TraF
MAPVLLHGDRVLVNQLVYRVRAPRLGEVVLASIPAIPGGWTIKRVAHILPSGHTGRGLAGIGTGAVHARAPRERYLLLGDNLVHSTDSRQLGPVVRAQVLGRVWYRYWPPQRRGPIH